MIGQVELSKRMQAVADMVTFGSRVCDVGCDHGYVSVYLVQTRRSPKVLAMDVNKGPLLRAKENVSRYRTQDYIELRLSDGLTAYQKGEADTLLCAGMGGRLLMMILSKEPDKTKDFKELILQPQSELQLFRKFLREKGYIFIKEDMILEDGKFYPIMKVKKAQEDNKEETEEEKSDRIRQREDLLGPLLLREKNPVLLQYVQKELQMKEAILDKLNRQVQTEKSTQRIDELSEEILLLKEAAAELLE